MSLFIKEERESVLMSVFTDYKDSEAEPQSDVEPDTPFQESADASDAEAQESDSDYPHSEPPSPVDYSNHHGVTISAYSYDHEEFNLVEAGKEIFKRQFSTMKSTTPSMPKFFRLELTPDKKIRNLPDINFGLWRRGRVRVRS